MRAWNWSSTPGTSPTLERQPPNGVPARSYGEPTVSAPQLRVTCKPHASAREHLEECLKKAWENASWGAALLVTNKHREALEGVHSSPYGCVPKTGPDRRPTGDVRTVCDQMEVNCDCPKEDQPPARQATVQQVARQVL